MGILQSALNSKALSRNGSEFLRVGTASMQGCRLSQEDAHRVVLELPKHENYSFFGVFDGHGGKEASNYLKRELIHSISSLETFDDKSIRDAIIKLDTKFISENIDSVRENGSTCVFALVERIESENDEENTRFNIICVNIGDSRCILLLKDGVWDPLSEDHKPENAIEKERIFKAGGSVIGNRVDGNLAVSRAFGDYSLKGNPSLSPSEQKVSCVPDIKRASCLAGDMLFLSCDGIFEHQTNNDVVQILRQSYESNKDLSKTLCELFERSLDSGSTDNMTGIFVHFINGNDYQFGEQYIPGPLYKYKSDNTYVESYLSDAIKNNFNDGPLLRLIAYHQDLKVLCESSEDAEIRKEIISEIRRFSPETISTQDLVTLINALNCSIVINIKNAQNWIEKGIKCAENLFSCLENDCESDKWKDLGVSDRVKEDLMFLRGIWFNNSTPTQNLENLKHNSPTNGSNCTEMSEKVQVKESKVEDVAIE